MLVPSAAGGAEQRSQQVPPLCVPFIEDAVVKFNTFIPATAACMHAGFAKRPA